MSKTVVGIILSLIILALVFVVTVLILGSVHNLSFVEEIKSWFDTAENAEPVVENTIQAISNVLKI